MRKCSLFIAQPPGMDIGVMGFFEVLLPGYVPEGFEFCIKPWDKRDVSLCVKVTKVEFTLTGEVNYMSDDGAHTAIFVEPVMDKTTATLEDWHQFSEIAAT